MISKEQFSAIKRMKSDGASVSNIARKVGVSEPIVRKWAKIDEAGFDLLKRDDIHTWISIANSLSASCAYAHKHAKPIFCTDLKRNFRNLNAAASNFTIHEVDYFTVSTSERFH